MRKQLAAPVGPIDHRYTDLAGCRSIANDDTTPNSMEGTVKKTTWERPFTHYRTQKEVPGLGMITIENR
jgi:hypothetical protein